MATYKSSCPSSISSFKRLVCRLPSMRLIRRPRGFRSRLILAITACAIILMLSTKSIKDLMDYLGETNSYDSYDNWARVAALQHRKERGERIKGVAPDQSSSVIVLESKIFPPGRKEFSELYQDDRLYFADGFSQDLNNIPSDDTDFSKLDQIKDPRLKKKQLEEILVDDIINSEVFSKFENLFMLIYASKWIKTQNDIDVTSLKSILVIHRKLAEWSEKARDYGDKFKLTSIQRNALLDLKPGAAPYVVPRKDTGGLVKDDRPWVTFLQTSDYNQMYEEDDEKLWRTLLELATSEVKKFYVPKSSKGESIDKKGEYPKMTLANGMDAWFTPMMYNRMHEKRPENYWMDDFERHSSIIATFHLDRILGFRRAFLTVGRLFHIQEELRAASSQPEKFFVSLLDNQCLVAHCTTRCTRAGNYVCGNPNHIEAALVLRSPSTIKQKARGTVPYPWRRSDIIGVRRRWEWDKNFCDELKKDAPYNEGRRLLDVVDMAILDFLQGNMARQNYDYIKYYGNMSFVVHNNNAYGFGSSYHDELSILAPLYQCCVLRHSTMISLLRLDEGPTYLSDYMRHSLFKDPLSPVLLEPQMLALDRRVRIILRVLQECLDKNSRASDVVIDDGL